MPNDVCATFAKEKSKAQSGKFRKQMVTTHQTSRDSRSSDMEVYPLKRSTEKGMGVGERAISGDRATGNNDQPRMIDAAYIDVYAWERLTID